MSLPTKQEIEKNISSSQTSGILGMPKVLSESKKVCCFLHIANFFSKGEGKKSKIGQGKYEIKRLAKKLRDREKSWKSMDGKVIQLRIVSDSVSDWSKKG